MHCVGIESRFLGDCGDAFEKNAVRPCCDVDLDVSAMGKKECSLFFLQSRAFKFEPRCMFLHPNAERTSESKCFSLCERATRGKIVPDREGVWTHCEMKHKASHLLWRRMVRLMICDRP